MNKKRHNFIISRYFYPLLIIGMLVVGILTASASYIQYYFNRYLLPLNPRSSGAFPSNAVWTFEANQLISSTPVISGDRIIVRTINSILALEASSGALVWETLSPSESEMSAFKLSLVPIVYEGYVIVPESGHVVALYSETNGELIFRIPFGTILTNPQVATIDAFIAKDNTLIVSYHDWKLIAYNLNTGEKTWEHEVPGRASLHLANDSSTVFLGTENLLKAYDIKTGDPLWEKRFNGYVGPINTDDDSIFIAITSDSEELTALNIHNKNVIWKIDGNVLGDIDQRRLTLYDDILFVSSNKLFAISKKDGTIRWVNNLGGLLENPVILGKWIFARNTENTLFMLDLTSGDEIGHLNIKVNSVMKHEPDRGPAVVDDLIIVPFGDNRIMAYRP